MPGYVVVTSKGQALQYEGRLVRFPSHEVAAIWAIAGDSIVPFDRAKHADLETRPLGRGRSGGAVRQHGNQRE